MVDDPLRDLDLPESVRILQQAVAIKQEDEVRSCPSEQWQKSSCGTLRDGSICDGDRHRLLLKRVTDAVISMTLHHWTMAHDNFE